MLETKDVLKHLRESHNYSIRDVANGTKMQYTMCREYESGDRKLGMSAAIKFADFYHVSLDYLLCRPEAKPPANALDQLFSEEPFSALEQELLRKYMELPHEARKAVVDFINDATERVMRKRKKVDSICIVRMKKSLHRTSAGIGYDLNDSDAWETIQVVDCPAAQKADFIVEIEGDSMEPDYSNGESVFVKLTPDVEIGSIGIFLVDGKGYLKERGTNCLISHNKKYPPIPLIGTENRCIGRVLGIAEIVG